MSIEDILRRGFEEKLVRIRSLQVQIDHEKRQLISDEEVLERGGYTWMADLRRKYA